MLRNPGKPVTIYVIVEIIGNAVLKVMTTVNITKTFKACGIFPFNRNLFDDDDFLPSSVTNRPDPIVHHVKKDLQYNIYDLRKNVSI